MDKKRREAGARAPRAVCRLPGHPSPLAFDSIAAFEAHYYAEHAFRCTAPLPTQTHATTLAARRRADECAPQCGKTFPSEHLLALHADECHSTLTIQRQERGEKTFACFEPLCDRKFATPKTRRHHLIAVHHYPPEFFFSVTNHGIGRLRELYGDGASLVRKPWKARNDRLKQDPHPPSTSMLPTENTAPALPVPRTPPAPVASKKRSLDSPPSASKSPPPSSPTSPPDLHTMLEQMSALSLVPRNVQRGTK